MRRLSRVAAALFVVAAAFPASLMAADQPPRVLGFERFHTADNDQAAGGTIAAGQLLLGELNCTSCHQADASTATHIQKKQAPVLDSVTSRVKPEYLLTFLADPQVAKPTTTMPNVLAGIPAAERKPIVEALVHFLATTGTVEHTNPMRQHVTRGEKLFHSIGCVACHDPRQDPAPAPLATSLPLGTPSRKYTLPGLTAFLSDPLAVRPSGRMPHLSLSAADARDIASFLLNDLEIASGLQYAYYEGSWDKLPDFIKLTPKATGDAVAFDLSVSPRKENFALRFDGTIRIDKEGEYLFLIGSDDGSRLLIDDKVVIDNDGIHPFQQKRKKVKMTAGIHSVAVEYFEQGGEESLQVEFEGPGATQLPLASLVVATKSSGTSAAPAKFVVDPALAAKGKEHFETLGCASCHTLRKDGAAVASTKTAPALAALKASGGCLGEAPAQTPWYGLGAKQREALSAAIDAAKQPAAGIAADQAIARTLVRFNCTACHERDKLGGVEEARNPHFQSDMPEMGDEGRLPPTLTGVGAKLNPQWLKTVFAEGAKDRPYMFTRMPRFGLENVGALVEGLAAADAALVVAEPKLDVDASDKRHKAIGRRLVGAQGFSCINCHTFADKRSTGIQALSLTTMTRRLRRDWFSAYLKNPAGFRPGTRMPTPFPNGETTLPDILEGSIDMQARAIWDYLADGDEAILPVGLVTGEIELVAFDEAVIYRNFIEGAGTRAIGVGYPAKLNLAFDANDMRLAMIWHGAFIDAAKHWTGRGAGWEKPLGDGVQQLPGGAPFATLSDANQAWPSTLAKESGYRFGGYRLGEKREPTFLYSFGGVQVSDRCRPVGESEYYVFERQLKLVAADPPSNLYMRIATGKIEPVKDNEYRIDDRLTVHLPGDAKPIVRGQGDTAELLVPVIFAGDTATLTLTYDW
jgi:mono/diheme cytochrome c family protein